MGRDRRRRDGRSKKVLTEDARKLKVAQDQGVQPFTEKEIASLQHAAKPILSLEAVKAIATFRACMKSKSRTKWQPGQVFASLCHSSAAAGMQKEHCVMAWGELAKALKAFARTTSLQALREAWCYTVENQERGLTFDDFMKWYWPGGEKMISGESSVMKKARLESPVLPASKETERMLSADIEAQLFSKLCVLQEKHSHEVETLQRRMIDSERCCAEVLEQQSAEGQKLQEQGQQLKQELQRANPLRNFCLVCFKLADWAIYPCGHTSYCETHGAVAKARGDSCPVCRGHITDGMKVFLSAMDS